MQEHISTYISLRNNGEIEEEIIGRAYVKLVLTSGATLKFPRTINLTNAMLK